MRIRPAILALILCSPGASASFGSAAPRFPELRESPEYNRLAREAHHLKRRLDTEQMGYHGMRQREQLKRDLEHLEKILEQAEKYALALPADCGGYFKAMRASQERQRVVVQHPGGRFEVPRMTATSSGAVEYGMANGQDLRCRPRGVVPDEVMVKLVEAEEARRRLDHNFAFAELTEKHQLEDRILELERELAVLGMPGLTGAPVTTIERVRPTVRGGRRVDSTEP